MLPHNRKNTSLALALVLTITVLCLVPSIQATCYGSCSSDSNCTRDGCSSCISGMCTCGGGKSVCQMRSSMFTCYDPATSICCPQSFSHGIGAVCPVGNTCCDSFSIKTCNDPTTSFCCPFGIYAASCRNGTTCCGRQYPSCVDPATSICCCGSFQCPLGSTCDCNNRTCVLPPPADTGVCGGVSCGAGESCCNNKWCYNTALYTCYPDGTLCAANNGNCNGHCYDSLNYICNAGVIRENPQNPPSSEPATNAVCGGNTCGSLNDRCCGDRCYDRMLYSCNDINGQKVLCSGNDGVCMNAGVAVCYNKNLYTCDVSGLVAK